MIRSRAAPAVPDVKTLLITALSVAALAAAGCGSGSSSGSKGSGYGAPPPTTTKAAAASPGTDAVGIADFKFAPATLTVDKGAKVTFSNSDTAPHTATADDKSFDTGTLNKGDKKSVTLGKPGTYKYHCSFHAFMEGEIVVK